MKINEISDIQFLSDRLVQKGIIGMNSLFFRAFIPLHNGVWNKIFNNISIPAADLIRKDILKYKLKHPDLAKAGDYSRKFLKHFNRNVKNEEYRLCGNVQNEVDFLLEELEETKDQEKIESINNEINALYRNADLEIILAKVFNN